MICRVDDIVLHLMKEAADTGIFTQVADVWASRTSDGFRIVAELADGRQLDQVRATSSPIPPQALAAIEAMVMNDSERLVQALRAAETVH